MEEIQRAWVGSSTDENAPSQLSPTRARLRAAIAALASAQDNLAEATAPVRRLDAVLAEAERLNREAAAARDDDEAALGRWIADGGVGNRPHLSATTGASSSRLSELTAQARAAVSALPVAKEAQEAAVERVRRAAAERDAALHGVAVEAATVAAGEFTEALNRALTIEATIRSLYEVLSTRHNGLAASEQISAAVRRAKAAAGVPWNQDAGRRLLDLLALDPAATL